MAVDCDARVVLNVCRSVLKIKYAVVGQKRMASIYDIPLAFGAESVTIDMVLQISFGYLGFVMAGPILHCMLIGPKRCESIQPLLTLVAIFAIFTLLMNLSVGFITALTIDDKTRRNANVRRWVWTFLLGFVIPMLLSFMQFQWYVLLPFSVLGVGISPIIATFTTPISTRMSPVVEKNLNQLADNLDRIADTFDKTSVDFVKHVDSVMDYAKNNIVIEFEGNVSSTTSVKNGRLYIK